MGLEGEHEAIMFKSLYAYLVERLPCFNFISKLLAHFGTREEILKQGIRKGKD